MIEASGIEWFWAGVIFVSPFVWFVAAFFIGERAEEKRWPTKRDV